MKKSINDNTWYNDNTIPLHKLLKGDRELGINIYVFYLPIVSVVLVFLRCGGYVNIFKNLLFTAYVVNFYINIS